MRFLRVEASALRTFLTSCSKAFFSLAVMSLMVGSVVDVDDCDGATVEAVGVAVGRDVGGGNGGGVGPGADAGWGWEEGRLVSMFLG